MKGWFSFQDYACSQWHNHVSTLIAKCGDFFEDARHDQQKSIKNFGSALTDFITQHRENLTTEQHRDHHDQILPQVEKFSRLPFYEDICLLFNHIYTHQKNTYDVRNTVGIAQIEEALKKNRDALETFTPSSKAVLNDTIKDYYGSNLFKCERVLCKFFYLGYDKKEDREAHNNRHVRPFTCSEPQCTFAPLGFSSKKDRERHVRIYHPHTIEGPSMFEAFRSRTGRAAFTCHICGKQFTRKITQLGHERSHFGERPYKCSLCDKAFARVSDCQRHRRIHSRQRP